MNQYQPNSAVDNSVPNIQDQMEAEKKRLEREDVERQQREGLRLGHLQGLHLNRVNTCVLVVKKVGTGIIIGYLSCWVLSKIVDNYSK